MAKKKQTPKRELAPPELDLGTTLTEPPKPPEFTADALIALGVQLVNTDDLLQIKIPSSVQKTLLAAGATVPGILAAFGFIGRAQIATDPETFEWTAWVKKNEPAPQPANPAHENLGLMWTALVQQAYQVRFNPPFSGALVAALLEKAKMAGLLT